MSICKPTENHNRPHSIITIRFLFGATPGDLISYCQAGDAIMADKGFKVQDILAPKDVGVIISTYIFQGDITTFYTRFKKKIRSYQKKEFTLD